MTTPAGSDVPLIAVSGRRRSARGVQTGPPQLDELDIDFYFTTYAERVHAAGAAAVHLPTDPAARHAIQRVDGLVLSGGVDIDPARYGAAPGRSGDSPDGRRDTVELALLEEALELDVPVLAICRGLQLVNVFLGGTLHQHLEEHPVGANHDVLIEPTSVLGGLHGSRTTVNSLHHQAVDRLGTGLEVSGRGTDGVVEAIELPGRDLLGVQWHPEQMAGSQPVFEWLTEVARKRATLR